MTSFLIILVTGATGFSFIAILRAWDEQISRAESRASINRALEDMVIDLHHASQLSVDSRRKRIRLRLTERGSTRFAIYYLQNETDGRCPSSFNANTLYTLRRARIGSLFGSFTCGAGEYSIRHIVAPSSLIKRSGNLIALDYSVRTKKSVIRVGTSVRTRNMA